MKTGMVAFLKRVPSATAPLACLLGLFGCATPQSRIERSPELFASLPTAEQQMIKEGRVALGFTPEMVRLALGGPDRLTAKTDAEGTREIWRYTTYERDDGVYLYRGYYHRFHMMGDPLFPYYSNYSRRRTLDYLRITFSGGRVIEIEQDR
jgi:hypothetical protein